MNACVARSGGLGFPFDRARRSEYMLEGLCSRYQYNIKIHRKQLKYKNKKSALEQAIPRIFRIISVPLV